MPTENSTTTKQRTVKSVSKTKASAKTAVKPVKKTEKISEKVQKPEIELTKKTAEKGSASKAASKKIEEVKTIFRTPIVAVMGHVDHGKTSLLDSIRGTNVQSGEYGGITQNTRAHKVEYKSGSFITFIDTPGHEAFAEMRSRGAKVADIAILVVAGDDGVQPQTKQSIKFIQAAKLPVIVACNKSDLPGFNADKIKQELSREGLLVEEYGGDAIFVPVSALKKTGIQDLLDTIELLVEVNDMQPLVPVQGVGETFVLESHMDKEVGAVTLVLVKSGSVKRGQFVIYNGKIQKIRALLDDKNKQLETGKQGDPIRLIGLSEVFKTGEQLTVLATHEEAETLRKQIEKAAEANAEVIGDAKSILGAIDDNDMFAQIMTTQTEKQNRDKVLNVIVRADTQGTLEAIKYQLGELSFADARVNVFSAQTGSVTENDVVMAKNIKGIVLGFQVRTEDNALVLARRDKVLVRSYQLIYDLIDEVAEVINSMVEPETTEAEVARSKVKMVIKLSDGKFVAGCEVIKGTVTRGYRAFVERKGQRVGDGKISSLKHLREDVKEAKKGTECGIVLEPQVALETGDEIVCFKVEQI